MGGRELVRHFEGLDLSRREMVAVDFIKTHNLHKSLEREHGGDAPDRKLMVNVVSQHLLSNVRSLQLGVFLVLLEKAKTHSELHPEVGKFYEAMLNHPNESWQRLRKVRSPPSQELKSDKEVKDAKYSMQNLLENDGYHPADPGRLKVIYKAFLKR